MEKQNEHKCVACGLPADPVTKFCDTCESVTAYNRGSGQPAADAAFGFGYSNTSYAFGSPGGIQFNYGMPALPIRKNSYETYPRVGLDLRTQAERDLDQGRLLWESRFRTEDRLCGGDSPEEIASTIKRLREK